MTATVLGKSFVVDGEVSGEDAVVVLGALTGQVRLAGTLVVGEGACVEATVSAGDAEIHGQLRGNLEARGRVEVSASAAVTGDIRAPRILIADGASFQGKVDVARG